MVVAFPVGPDVLSICLAVLDPELVVELDGAVPDGLVELVLTPLLERLARLEADDAQDLAVLGLVAVIRDEARLLLKLAQELGPEPGLLFEISYVAIALSEQADDHSHP